MRSFSYNIYSLILNNFLYIPFQLRKENRFCLWKYEQFNLPNKKLIKKPYGIDCFNNIIPSLKNTKYWFSLGQISYLDYELQLEYGLGFILNDSSYIVIDLDNCVLFKDGQLIVSKEIQQILDLFPNAYCEVSPSNTGLHIIFQGEWPIRSNKAKRYIYENLNRGTVEVYSGHNCRYITLTGKSIKKINIKSNLPYFSFDGESLQELYKRFFCIETLSLSSQSLLQNDLVNSGDEYQFLNNNYLFIKAKILSSKFSLVYNDLCKMNNPNYKYKSTSEADWFYLCLVKDFFDSSLIYEKKYSLLEYFYNLDRPERNKKKRKDYIKITIEKVLKLPLFVKSINSKYTFADKVREVDKNKVIKLCNTMNIFHIGQTVKNMEYENSKTDNYLKANIPHSLNQTDFKYYIEILFQYINQVKKYSDIKFAQDEFVLINLNIIFKNLNMSNGGRSYLHFEKSLNKLSDITLTYNKKITLDGIRSIYKDSLIAYKVLYKCSDKLCENKSSNSLKKIAIKMHPIILDMYKDATYNYTLFNIESYNKIISDKLKLFYYYFCCLTFPGGYCINLSINDLLLLWPKTHLRQVVCQRKKEIIQLLQDFINLKTELDDLDVKLIYKQSQVIGIQVNKRKLNLI